uniref:FTH domain-containing protein n=1 Tax=Caenorhabditis tropicalis TaxID=1561998 RepID=A0A1I7TVL2_9PELO
MPVPSLVNLSSKVVAQCLAKDRYRHRNISLGEPLSDQVFFRLTRITRNVSHVIAKESGLKLNLTEFHSGPFQVSPEDYENLRLHDIRSLGLDLNKFSNDPEYRGATKRGVDIVLVLKVCLNPDSRQYLKQLKFYYLGELPDNWIELLGETLPNLQNLNCRIKDEDLGRVCKSFPNLVSLTPVLVDDLTGIRHAKNLQKLTFIKSGFKSPEQLKELFELPNLRALDISGSVGFFENILLCEGSFQNLKYVECGESHITGTQIRTLVERNPSLEIIHLLHASCKFVDFSDLPVTVINLGTFESIMNVLRNRLDKFVLPGDEIVENSLSGLEKVLKRRNISGFKEYEFLKMMKEVTLKISPEDDEENLVAICLHRYFKRFFPRQSMKKIIKNLDRKSPLFVKRRWAARLVMRYLSEESN